MITNSDFEKIFYLYTRENPKYLKTISNDFYENEYVSTLHSVTTQFFNRFNEIPSKEQLKLVAIQEKFKDKITSGLIDIIFDEPISSYDPEWVESTCQSWILWKSLDKSLIDTLEFVKTVKVTPDNVKDIINKVKNLINERNSISFDDDLGKSFFEFENHNAGSESKITTCHNWIDNYTGGYRKKGLVVFAGSPNVGKSVFLSNEAVNYVKAGFDVALITAEMADVDFIHRIGSNMLNIKISEYESKSKQSDVIKNKLNQLTNGIIPPGNLYVKEYPTSQATTLDIEGYLLKLEEVKGIKLSIIVIDYINILCNHRNPNSENTYMKIKQISEDLRAIAMKHDWLIISATQFNRSADDSTEVTVNSIAESAGLVHTCDMIYGIIQDSIMHANSEYWLKLLKVRNGSGKNSKCRYKVDYNYMRLIETDEIITASM